MASLDRMPGAGLVLDETYSILDTNERCRVVFGDDDLQGAALSTLEDDGLIDAQSRQAWEDAVTTVLGDQGEATGRVTVREAGGGEPLRYRLTVRAAEAGVRCSLRSVGTGQRYGETITALHGATRDLMTAADREEVLARTAEAAAEVLGFPGTGVRVYDPDAAVLRSVSLGGRVDDVDSRPPYPVEDSPHGEAFRRGETVVEDVDEEDPYDREVFSQTMYVPVGDVALLSLGIIAGEFDESDVQFAEILAENAAAALRVVETTTTLRRERERLDLLKQILTRVLRHNVRNYANVIQCNARDLADEAPDEEAAEHILECIDDLIDVSEKAREVEHVVDSAGSRRSVDLQRVVDEAVERIARNFPEAVVETDVDACTVRAHERLPLAVENLIENACEHAQQPTVAVESTVADGTARLSVTDDGPGIPPGEIEVLEAESETDLSHGSGLGLWIVKLVADMSEGSVEFETGHEWTRVTLLLPLAEE
jgi:signal transduction histidine kinase